MRYILPSTTGQPTRMWAGGWGERVYLQPSNYPIRLDGLNFSPIEAGPTNMPGVFFAADGVGVARFEGDPDPQHSERWTHFAPLDPERRYKVPEDGLYIGDIGIESTTILMSLQGKWYKLVMQRNDEGSCYVIAESAAVIVGTKLKIVAPLTFSLRRRRGAPVQEGAAAPIEPTPHEE